ncbi:hypothetical protein [Maribacter aestuarii]|uniref:hypothetical protein n=1 Tax=Maribacter aestuarii TaxID=1130723 RepID=UPI00248C20D3|nr:hypothetical protein [Maribacter aestuarii]
MDRVTRNILLKYSKGFGMVLMFMIFTSHIPIDFSNVYICKGKYSEKYHYNKTCRGLSNCSTAVEEVELNEAKRIGRTICGWED